MTQERRDGFYKDDTGQWRHDRRKTDRRGAGRMHPDARERRKHFRRKADRELYELDHKTMIKEALEDFAEEHDGRL